MTTLLQHLDNLVLVLREDFSEAISPLAEIINRVASHVAVQQLVGVVHLGSKSKHTAGLLSNGNGITSKHLDLKTKGLGIGNGLGSVRAGRVEQRQHTQHLPGTISLADGNSQGSETTAGKLRGLGLEHGRLFFGNVASLEHGVGSTLAALVADAVVGTDSSNSLGDGVEGSELLGRPALRDHFLGLGVSLQGKNGDLVDGVQSLDVVAGSKRSNGHHPVDVDTVHEERLTNGKLVSGQGTGLVRAENVDTSKGLDGGKLLHNGLLLGEVGGTDGKSSGCDNGQTDRHTDDEQNEDVVEQVGGVLGAANNVQVAVETTNPGSEHEEDDENQKRSTDGVHNGLEVTLVLGALDEGRSTSDERSLSTMGDDTVSLAALATSGVVAAVGHVLVDCEGLSGDGRLIDGNERVSNVRNSLRVVVLRLKLLSVGGGDILGSQFGLVLLESFLATFVVANETNIGGHDGTFLNNNLFLG